jgi:hypothetical protein
MKLRKGKPPARNLHQQETLRDLQQAEEVRGMAATLLSEALHADRMADAQLKEAQRQHRRVTS